MLLHSTRTGWREFVENNVAHAHPDVRTVPIDHRRWLGGADRLQDPGWVLRDPCGTGRRPLLLIIRNHTVLARSLHASLLPMKTNAEKSSATRERVRAVLDAHLRALEAECLAPPVARARS